MAAILAAIMGCDARLPTAEQDRRRRPVLSLGLSYAMETSRSVYSRNRTILSSRTVKT
jgi:hypothetical protein